MATKNTTMNTLVKNRKAIFDLGCTIHDEVINASNVLIEETVNTITKSQKIAGKIIKNGEPIVAKQVEMTIEILGEVKNQAVNSRKRALKLLGLTKQYDAVSKQISKRVDQLPTTGEIVDNAKDMVANAKSDVEKTITKAAATIKKAANTAEKAIESKTEELSKTIKNSTTGKKKGTPAKPVAKAKTSVASKTTAKAKAPVAAKKAVQAKKTATVKKVAAAVKSVEKNAEKKAITTNVKVAAVKAPAKKAPAKKVVADPATDLVKIKGIGPSLATLMHDNGIKSIAELTVATPEQLAVVTTKAGNRYASFDTSKWIDAAKAMGQS